MLLGVVDFTMVFLSLVQIVFKLMFISLVYIPLYLFFVYLKQLCVFFVVSILIVCVFVEDLYPLTKPSENSGVTMNWWFRSCRRIDFRARRDTTSVRSHFNNGTLKSLQSGTCYNRVELEVPAINLPKFAFRLLT